MCVELEGKAGVGLEFLPGNRVKVVKGAGGYKGGVVSTKKFFRTEKFHFEF